MRKLLFHPISVVVITILAVVYFMSLRTTTQHATQPSKTVQELQQEVSQLSSEVTELETQVTAAQTDFAKEKIIRDELLLQKPGEYVVQLGEQVQLPTASAQPSATPTPWEMWKKVLF